jgi:hypothetical protein
VQKSYYVDGHEREEQKQHRQKFCSEYLALEQRMHRWVQLTSAQLLICSHLSLTITKLLQKVAYILILKQMKFYSNFMLMTISVCKIIGEGVDLAHELVHEVPRKKRGKKRCIDIV